MTEAENASETDRDSDSSAQREDPPGHDQDSEPTAAPELIEEDSERDQAEG